MSGELAHFRGWALLYRHGSHQLMVRSVPVQLQSMQQSAGLALVQLHDSGLDAGIGNTEAAAGTAAVTASCHQDL